MRKRTKMPLEINMSISDVSCSGVERYSILSNLANKRSSFFIRSPGEISPFSYAVRKERCEEDEREAEEEGE